MTKKGCCCKEENPLVKHYIAIKCYEYTTKYYKRVGSNIIFNDFPPTASTTGLDEPHFPFTVTGIGETGLSIAKDSSRRIKMMLRGSGGGAPREGYGGNGAYIDFNLVPFNITTTITMSVFVGGGGTGGIHTNFSTSTQDPYGGGGGFPLAGWGGGAVAYGTGSIVEGLIEEGNNTQALQIGGEYVVGSGAGAGADFNLDSRFGGHGGVDNGEPGDGPSPGNAATQTQGGAGGANAGAGYARVGGYGYRPTPSGNIPIQNVGGGGGAGYFGGGGGGPNSSGGGGSSTKFDIFSQNPIDQGFDGTSIGPGSRCSPFFEKLNKDSGIGANNLGRYLQAINTEYVSFFNGQPGQGAEYHRTRWCPCNESQSTNDVRGVFPNGPNYICLSEGQVSLITGEAFANLPDYNSIFSAGATDVKLSFELNGERYILVTWLDDDFTDPYDLYYCTLGCEPEYIADGIPSNVKWFVPTTNVFANYSDSRNFFKNLYEDYGIDLSTVTGCCDIFIGERICRPPNFNCTSTIDPQGNLQGCYCSDPDTAPKYKSICRSGVDTDSPFIAIDEPSGFYYLCIPAFGWRRFGNDSVNTLYDFYDGFNSENQINLGNSLSYYADADTLDIDQLKQQLCDDSGSNSNVTIICNTGPSDGDCICRVVFNNDYSFPDPEGINGFLTFIHSNAKLCVRNLYGVGGNSSCGFCPEEEAVPLELITTFSFNACTQRRICDVEGCWDGDQSCYQKCNITPLVCNTPFPYNLTGLFAGIKKSLSNLPNYIFTNLYRAGPLLMDSKTKNVTYTPQNILTNPCDSGIPTTGCFDATFTGFKAHIERTPCLSTDAVKAICCDQCGCQKEQCEMAQYVTYDNVIVEHKSYETQMCIYISKQTEEYEATAMEVVLNPCLFAGMTNNDMLLKAEQLLKLEKTSYIKKICGENCTLNGYRIKVCKQCVDLVGAPISSAANIINLCTAPFATAYPIDDSGWYGDRIMTCGSDCCGCEDQSPKIKDGDNLTLTYSIVGGTVKGTFNFKSPKYKCCVTFRADPICDTQDGSEETDCYTFDGSFTPAYIEGVFISASGVSYPEWKNGTRWNFVVETPDNFCFQEAGGPRGGQSCSVIKCSQYVFSDDPNNCNADTKGCCSERTGCGDNAKSCSDVQDITQFCDLCQPYTCCNPGVDYTDCVIQGFGGNSSGCSGTCLSQADGGPTPCSGCKCQINKIGQNQDTPCITDYGTISVF
jgi:hypothetical protein